MYERIEIGNTKTYFAVVIVESLLQGQCKHVQQIMTLFIHCALCVPAYIHAYLFGYRCYNYLRVTFMMSNALRVFE